MHCIGKAQSKGRLLTSYPPASKSIYVLQRGHVSIKTVAQGQRNCAGEKTLHTALALDPALSDINSIQAIVFKQ